MSNGVEIEGPVALARFEVSDGPSSKRWLFAKPTTEHNIIVLCVAVSRFS